MVNPGIRLASRDLLLRRIVVAAGPEPRRPAAALRTLFRLSVAKLYTDQVIPTGGVSGSVLVMKALTRRGVPPGRDGSASGQHGVVLRRRCVEAITCLGLLWLHHDADFPILVLVSSSC